MGALLAWIPEGIVPAAAWLLAAWGYGRITRSLLFGGPDAAPRIAPDAEPAARDALSLGLGIAVLLGVDAALGSLGAFGAGPWRRAGAIAVLAVGAALGLVRRRGGTGGAAARASWTTWTAAWPAMAAVAVLCFAAALPPGVAWATEFGGYDALSYHLQLPKEWLESGRVAPMRHSAYSALPSFMETASLHAWTAASFMPVHEVCGSAQWLHAGVAVAAALATGALAASLLAPDADARPVRLAAGVATVGILGIPWVIVTGSLAYSDLGPVLFLACAMLAWHVHGARRPGRAGIAVGLALGAAFGCKPTALGMVVLPFVLWAAASAPPGGSRGLVRGAAFAVPVAACVLLPWMVRNGVTVGNPFFPLVGAAPGWWDAGQAARFAAGHAAPAGTGIGARLVALWDQGFREGMGAAPDADPWLPQWGIAFGAGCAALAVAGTRRTRQGAALAVAFAAQCGFWMLATHLQSRFLLPCAVPLCAAAGIACAPAAPVGAERPRRAMRAAVAGLLIAWSCQPILVLRMDPRMTNPEGPVANLAALGPAVRDLGPGTKADADAMAAEGAPMPLAWIANWRLPPGAVLGCEGEADVFWIRRTPAWGTVWDGGPLARALRAHPARPAEAIGALRSEGITHLAVGWPMLARWAEAGWLDPALAPDAVRAVTERLVPVARTASGGMVYALDAAAPATPPARRPAGSAATGQP